MVAAAQLNVLDPNALGDLKRLSRDNSPEGLRAAAQQFEAMFLQMVLKSMRDATPQNGLFDSDQTRLFQSMQDQQLAMNMAQGRGIGLADVIFRQLGGEAATAAQAADPAVGIESLLEQAAMPARTAISAVRPRPAEKAAADTATLAAGVSAALAVGNATAAGEPLTPEVVKVPEGAREFVNRVWAHAGDASRSTGIPAHFMVAQAALETGWGRAELRRADGSPSHNLFNIKAGADWKGAVVEVPVKEYANGRTYTENARFRAYGSYAEAFRDYANLLSNSPRYAEVLGQQDGAGFARSLQQAGYATDPMYADKLTRIISGSTLRGALSG
jgi:flagellar protein FlgJ